MNKTKKSKLSKKNKTHKLKGGNNNNNSRTKFILNAFKKYYFNQKSFDERDIPDSLTTHTFYVACGKFISYKQIIKQENTGLPLKDLPSYTSVELIEDDFKNTKGNLDLVHKFIS